MLGSINWFHLVSLMVKRDLKVRYRGSLLGYAWSMLNPLISMLILATIFSHVVRIETRSYPLFVLSGLICWNLFSQGISSGIHSIINNSYILRKVAVPSWVFPTATLSSAAMNAGLALIPYFLIAIWLRDIPTLTVVQIPLVFALFYLFTHGVVMALSSLNVLFRDVGHVIDPVLQIAFYGTPILYGIGSVPEKIQNLMKFNPAFHFIHAWRTAIYDHAWIAPQAWLVLIVMSGCSVFAGRLIYQRLKKEFIYSL